MPRLAVDAQDRLGAREADEHPAAVFETELEAVHGHEFGYFQPAEGLRVVVPDDLLARGAVTAKGTVHAVVEKLASNFREQIFQQFSRFLACLDHEIEHVQPGENPVAFGDIVAEGVAARFLAANQRVRLGHFRRDEFESHACLVDGYTVDLAEDVQHACRGQGFYDGAAQAADFQQVIRQQGVHAQLVDEPPVLVADAATVRVAVGDEQNVRFVVHGGFQTHVNIRLDRFGTFHLREGRIADIVNFDHLGLSARQQACKPARAVTPHRVHHHGQPRVFDGAQVNQPIPRQMLDVRRRRIELDDASLLYANVER